MPKTKIKLLEAYEKELIAKGVRKMGLTIAVSGIGGAGKSSVVGMLLKEFPKLKLVYSGGIFRENARKAGMTIEEYSKTRGTDVDKEIDASLLEKGMGGNIVADGHIASWVLGGWADFRIFVTAPENLRVERFAKRENVSREEAREMLRERNAANAKRYREFYGVDINDMGIYDFIVDNSGSLEELQLGVRKIAERIRKT